MDFVTYFPIGLLSIAAKIKNICELKIFDCLITDFEIRKTEDFTLYGTPSEKIKTAIKDFNPDIIGISTPYSTQSESAKTVCKISKEVKPGALVILGGPDASVRYEYLLKETCCDFCVVGEGEETFYEFVKNFNSKLSLRNIEGLAYKTDDTVHYKPRKFLENLDELSFPAYDAIDINAYLKNRYLYRNRSILKNSITIITSRGCPFDCVFCSIKFHMGKKYRYHSPDYVIRHLKFLIKNYGITNFHFEDDNISLDKHRFEQILDKIIENKLKIKWDVPNGIRTDTLDFNLLKKIKKSGCKELVIGIESGNQSVLNKVIKKNTSLDYMLKIVSYCKELRIKASAFYVIGFPGESIKNIKETTDLALKLYREYDILPILQFAIPLYGTELYKVCVENGFIKKDLSDRALALTGQILGDPLISTEDFSKEDVKNLVRSYILKLYLLRLKKDLIIYAVKHPFLTFKKIKVRLRIMSGF